MVARLYHYRLEKREGLILQYKDGLGEIAPLPGWSREALSEALSETLSLLSDLPHAKAQLASVQFGISCALRPFSLAPLRVPLCALHTPRPGCSSLKLKLGSLSPESAIQLVRPYLGRYRLRLDVNRAWTLDQALQFASAFSPDDFDYLEEPVSSFSDLIQFSRLTHFPIAVDESLQDSPFLEVPTLKAAIVKPTLLGKIPPLPPSLPLILSSSYESSLGILQIARLSSSPLPQGLDTFAEDLLVPPLQVEEGHLTWVPSSQPLNMSKLCLLATAP